MWRCEHGGRVGGQVDHLSKEMEGISIQERVGINTGLSGREAYYGGF